MHEVMGKAESGVTASEACLGVLSGQQGTFSAGIVLFRGTIDSTILNTTKVKPSCIPSPVSFARALVVIVEAFARTRARHQMIMYTQYRSELLETDAEAGVSGAEQEDFAVESQS